jgi:hypothetical protein
MLPSNHKSTPRSSQGDKPAKRTGRPVEAIPQAKADSIVAWISEGQTIREWCRIPGNPVYSTVYEWIDKDAEFATRIARAREIGEELISQECLLIADTPEPGQITTEKADGTTEVKVADMLEHRKLRIDTRLKLLAKWNPKKFGDRLNQVHSGSVTLEGLVCGDDRSPA